MGREKEDMIIIDWNREKAKPFFGAFSSEFLKYQEYVINIRSICILGTSISKYPTYYILSELDQKSCHIG